MVPSKPVRNQGTNFGPAAITLLEDVRHRAAEYFLERADAGTGLVYDRAPASGKGEGPQYASASIAATGFGLSALCLAALHGYLPVGQCHERVMRTLHFLAERAPHMHGFFPHYLDARTGAREAGTEFSSIDTALLLCGALHARSVLNSHEADKLVGTIYDRIEWPWMLDGGKGDAAATLCMGWLPESGFLKARWDSYSECVLMYLLAMGSPTHPLGAASWNAIQRNTFDYGGIRFVSSLGALFIHQYPHVWLDLRGKRDAFMDYVENSMAATRAHKTWCLLQHGQYSWIDERVWGFSASDTERAGYEAWAAPPAIGMWDGTLTPHAAGGSLALLPEECIVALMAMREHHPRSFERYGFVDAFNPGANGGAGWYDRDVIAIDLGLTMLMAENQQTRSVQREFMKSPEVARAMLVAGLVGEHS